MAAGAEQLRAEDAVLVGVVRHYDRVHVAVEEVVELLEQLHLHPELVGAFLDVVEKRLVFVAYSHELRVRMVKQHLDHRAAASAAENADFKFF